MGESPARRAKMRKKMRKNEEKIRKFDQNLGKVKPLPTLDSEAGYSPVQEQDFTNYTPIRLAG